MCDPAIRVWLIFLMIYGRMSDLDCSMKRFLNYTQNDTAGTAYKAPRVVRSRCAHLDAVAAEDSDPLQHADFDELRAFVESQPAVYTDLDAVRKIVRTGARRAVFYFRGANGEDSAPQDQRALRWLHFVPLIVLGLMDDKGAVMNARSLLKLKRQGVGGYAASMLPYMPSGLKKAELEKAILDAKAGPCVACQPQFNPLLEKLASQPAEGTTLKSLFDDREVGAAAKELHALLYELRFTPVGNFVSETVVKTLEHGLHGTQRRRQQYATMLVAARHRPQRWEMTDADYAWASKEIGTNKASRKTVKRELNLQLQSVSLNSEQSALEQEALWLQEDELQEDEPTPDEADEAATDDDRGGMAGCAQDPKVKVSDIARALSDDTVIEVLWEYGADGEAIVYLALIEEVKKRIVRARWLHEIEECDDVFIIDPNDATVSIEMKLVWDTCADVTEPAGARPDGVPDGARWWRRAASEDDDAADEEELAAEEEMAAASSSSSRASAAVAPATAQSGSPTAQQRGTAAEPIELEEPQLFGRARELRDGDCAYPSRNPQQWLSDVHLANAHAADHRWEGALLQLSIPRPLRSGSRPAPHLANPELTELTRVQGACPYATTTRGQLISCRACSRSDRPCAP